MTQEEGREMAQTSNVERLGPQHPSQPAIYSQHSNSVPSTPYQQARDLRFHSRSPSPRRGLAGQSPRSVTSEAPRRSSVLNSQPGVCRFESGSEWKKRRIPYVDGGNEELGPPKKEPKRTLAPDEREKLSGDMRELYDRLLPSEESEDRRARLVAKLQRILSEEWPEGNIRVHVFGSSGNLLSSSDSDVDICVTTSLKKLESMHALATLLHKNGMERVVCRASAKVPIVKCWDPELELATDLNVNNTLALENTRMIKTYVQLDERVRPLAKIIKHWTKQRMLNDAAYGATISSYTWICMILSFLQRRDPPILPSLQKTSRGRQGCENGEDSKFVDDVEALKGFSDANEETLGDLLFLFFRHYGYEFDFAKYVISVREGALLSRAEKGWDPSNYQNKEAQNRLCVEEPFTVNRNLGNSADDYAWTGIHAEIRRAFELLANGAQLERCCEQFEFPLEEAKPLFQRPTPKPKPTLTRSASQSGRSNGEQGSGRSKKGGNRNQSTQRSGNRRASSGASFSNQRVPLGFQSPPMGGSPADYFAVKGDLHNQLYQHYQFLQAQQDVLRSQLARQQEQQQSGHIQSSVRSADASGSPHHHRAYTNGLPSLRYPDLPPMTAPLFPVPSLYQYAARYPPPPQMSQARPRDGGTSTNPSSPSMTSAVPALQRQVHRNTVQEGATSSVRSQSQPGRSLPSRLMMQQQMLPAYDPAGVFSTHYSNGRPPPQLPQILPQGQLGMNMSYSPLSSSYSSSQSMDCATPKEYVGYYVGQSPMLGPQYANSNQPQMAPMTLQNPPAQRPRRVTPDLMPPRMNGRHTSRSPSPLGRWRSLSNTARSLAVQSDVLESPLEYQQPVVRASEADIALPNFGGPLIVNGSTNASNQKRAERINGELSSGLDDVASSAFEDDLHRIRSLPLRPNPNTSLVERTTANHTTSSPVTLSSSSMKPAPKLDIPSNCTPPHINGKLDHIQLESTPISAPLLSPVAELRTPSPTHSNTYDRESPRMNGISKTTRIATAKPLNFDENVRPISPTAVRHERNGSAPNLTTTTKLATSPPHLAPTPIVSQAANQDVNSNPWQQATRKGHKKSKSIASAKLSPQGQPLPANEAERKGG